MGTTTTLESQRALAWMLRQLSWERTLEQLRQQAAEAEAAERHEHEQEKVAA